MRMRVSLLVLGLVSITLLVGCGGDPSQAALDAAKEVDQRIQTELIDLGGLNISPWSPEPPDDDMAAILPKFRDPALGGIIIGSPCYFRSLSGLAKCFLERLAPLRKPEMLLAGKPFGVVTVGGFRNGGQELTIQSVLTALLSQEMIVVGDGKPTAHIGGTLWNSGEAGISSDEFGIATAKNLGRRVAEVALRLRK